MQESNSGRANLQVLTIWNESCFQISFPVPKSGLVAGLQSIHASCQFSEYILCTAYRCCGLATGKLITSFSLDHRIVPWNSFRPGFLPGPEQRTDVMRLWCYRGFFPLVKAAELESNLAIKAKGCLYRHLQLLPMETNKHK